MQKRTQLGFTLYELLITVLIVAIVLSIGVPNLGEFTRNSRVTGLANDLHGSFYLARSEAARAKLPVTICASAAPFGAAACNGAGFDDGWIVFVDANGNGVRDAAGDNVLKAFPPAHDTIHIHASGKKFTFAATGLGIEGTPFIAMICDQRGNTIAPGGDSAARRIVVSPIGRSTIIKSITAIDASIAAFDGDDPLDVTCD